VMASQGVMLGASCVGPALVLPMMRKQCLQGRCCRPGCEGAFFSLSSVGQGCPGSHASSVCQAIAGWHGQNHEEAHLPIRPCPRVSCSPTDDVPKPICPCPCSCPILCAGRVQGCQGVRAVLRARDGGAEKREGGAGGAQTQGVCKYLESSFDEQANCRYTAGREVERVKGFVE